MLSYGSSQKLKTLMVALGDGERDLEAARQRLCSIRDFALHSAFERLDRDCSNSISSREIVNFLRDNAVFHVSDSEAHALVSFFDSDGNIYIEIRKEMYGLTQAGRLANDRLRKILAPHGYRPCRNTPGLWKHNNI